MTKSLKASLRKSIVGIVMMTTIFSLSGIAGVISTAKAATFVTGDLVRNPSASGMAQFDVYVVKVVGTKMFKRLILSPAIFNSYGGLFKWSDVKTVSSADMNSFTTSGMVRIETGAPVFAVAPVDGSDVGSKSWLNVSADTFVAAGGDWDAIYTINTIDGAGYSAATDLTTQAQVSTYLTTGVLPGGSVPTPTPVVGGTVGVSLAANTAASTTLTLGSTGNSVLSFNVTAAADADAVLNTVKFKRTGVGLSTDYSTVYIYDGETRLKTGKSISSDTNTVEFTSINLTIAKGTSKVLTVKADVLATATAGNNNIIGIQAASDIAFTAGTVSGTFPINGNGMNIGAQAVGTVIIANGASTISKPNLGQSGAKLANIKVTAGVNDVEIRALTLVQNGSFSNASIKNVTVKNSVTNDVLGTVAGMTGEKAVVTLTSPLTITKSQNKTLDIYGDISGGKTTDTIRFYLEETTDVVVIDKQFGQGSAITNSFGSTAAYCVGVAANACAATGSLLGGAITLADNGPAATTVANNTTNVDLLKFSMTSTRNVTVKDYNIVLTATNKANGTLGADPAAMTIGTESAAVTITAHGLAVGDYIIIDSDAGATYSTTIDTIAKVTTVTDANTIEVTPVSGTDLDAGNAAIWSTIMRVDVVRLTDTDTNNVVYSSSTVRYYTSADLTDTINASDDFDFTAGQTRHLALRADINSYTSGGMTLNGMVDFNDASTIKDNDANEYIAAADVVPGTLTGKNMTTGAASLTVALASTPVSATKVVGTQAVDILGVSLSSGSSSKSKITNLVVRFVADVDATFTLGTGDTAANSLVTSASLFDGTTQVGTTKTLVSVGWVTDSAGYYSATFDNLSYEIPAGTSTKLTVRVNLTNTLAANTYLAADINAATDVTAQDKDGNALTISGTGISRATQATATLVPVFLISTAGTLSVNVEGSPSAAIVVAGATNVVMAKYKVNALNEAFTIEKLDVASDTGTTDFATAEATNDNDLVRVGIRAGGVTTWANVTAGIASFSGLTINVPANGSTYVEVLADLNTIASGATSGESPRLGLYQLQTSTNNFRAVGTGSSTVLTFTTLLNTSVTGEENIKAMVLRKTAPTVAKSTGMSTTLVNGENTLYGFTVAADAGAAVSMKRIALTMTGTNAALTTSNMKFYRGAANITDSVLVYHPTLGTLEGATDLLTGTAATTVYILWDGTNEETISAGGSNTYYLKSTIAGAIATYSISTYIADDETTGGTITGIAAIGGYNTATANFYHAAGTTVAANDIRGAAITSVDSAYAVSGTTGVIAALVEGTDEVQSYGTVTTGQTIILTEVGGSATGSIAAITTGTLITTGGFTCTSYADADGSGAATLAFADIQSVKCVNATTSSQVILNTQLVADVANQTQATTITLTTGTYAAGTVVAAADSDLGLATNVASVAAGTTRNFVWSDNSDTSHAITTADWTNGFLVNDLSTAAQSLLY